MIIIPLSPFVHSLRALRDAYYNLRNTMADEHDSETQSSDPFETPTIVPPQRADPDARPDFPVPDWEKYKFISYIGHGGMGRVFLAEDIKLKRNVALKFLRGDDPGMSQRFLREAQTQAGIEHPNVCKVYEAGEVAGKLYIAMQHIHGETLAKLHSGMNLEEKVKVLHDVAQGVHAAHRTGLIHRDIKPGNIMLERAEDGDWHPYILDFGLAREIDAEGMTVTGALVGTPRYMAPEQAWGEKGLLDRRADIYSLGATLYEILSGHAPVEADSTMGILKKMLQEEPQSLGKYAPKVPRDLQTIVMKCLEREPQRRYDTAQALADDLERFLNGDPVSARPASLSYRLSRKAQKHRTLVTVIAVAFVAFLALGITALRGQMEARKRAELAQRFGQQVERMDAVLRIGREIPAHDTRGEQETVRRMIRDVQSQMSVIGSAAQGPGLYAIGRGHLSLDEPQAARDSLEKAWTAGYREPEVAYSLGLALGKLYQSELQKIEAIKNKEEREKRLREAQSQYRDPAVRYLKLSANAENAAPEYAEGLIAFYENKHDEALSRASAAVKRLPWLYEAWLLEGDVYVAVGNAKRNSGEYEAAESEYARAQSAYQAALRIGESDIKVYENLLSLQINRVNLALYGKGGDLGPPVSEAMKVSREARQIDPDNARIPADESMLHRMVAEDQYNRGGDPSAELAAAVGAAEQALKRDPANARAYANLGTARELQAELQIGTGADPQKTMSQAIRELQKAAELDPKDSYVHNVLCIAHNVTGQYQGSHGMDPTASYLGAVDSGNHAVALNSQNTNALINLGTAHALLAYYQNDHGIDPRENFKQAEATLQKALQINPRSAYAWNNLGSIYIRRGNFEKDHGANPQPTYERGLQALQKVNEIYPDDAFPYFNARDACRGMAEYELRSGRNPEPWIQRAEDNFHKGIQRNASLPGSYVDEAHVLELRIRYQTRNAQNPAASIAAARAYLNKTFQLDPHKASAIVMRGVLSMLEGSHAQTTHRNPEALWNNAESDLRAGAKEDAQNPENWLYLAELFLLRAQSTPSLEMIRQGISAADAALKLNSGLALAHLYRAQLLDLQAKADSTGREKLLASAKEARDKAASINPLLR